MRSLAEGVLAVLAFQLWHPHQKISCTVNFSVNQYSHRGLTLPVVDLVSMRGVVGHSGQSANCVRQRKATERSGRVH